MEKTGTFLNNQKCPICSAEDIRKRCVIAEGDLLACRKCGTEFHSLVFSSNHLDEHYQEDYYKGREEYYFNNIVMNETEGAHNDTIADFEGCLAYLDSLIKPGKILDVGCALGTFISLAKKKGWEAYGIDISKYAAEYARKKFDVDARPGRLLEQRFPDAYFDVVTLWDVFEHFQDPRSELAECSRILKPGGILFLDTPNQEALLRRLAHAIYNATFGKVNYPIRKLYHQFHLFYFSQSVVRQLLESSGFQVELLYRKPIPIVKARGNLMEKGVVKTLAAMEKLLKMEYEIVIYARRENQKHEG